MNSSSFRLNSLALVLLALVFASLGNAQPGRTWVSGVGDDMNPCSRTAPCRTFQVAYEKTAVGGEVNCRDSGEFGPVDITKAITIDCGETFGSILAPSNPNAPAITIGANATIRNVSLHGFGMAGYGVQYFGGKIVRLENITCAGVAVCVVAVNTGSSGQATIENSTFSDCGGGLSIDIVSSGIWAVDIHNTRITNCNVAISAANGARVDVRNSVISMNGTGIAQVGDPGGSTVLVTDSTLALNGTALHSAFGTFLGASGNTFSNNTITVYNSSSGGAIYTGNDNVLFGNAATGSATGVLTKN